MCTGSDGDVRLTGSIVPEAGNVEYCIDGIWTGACDANWDSKDAFVVCRQLGLPATGNNNVSNIYMQYTLSSIACKQITYTKRI